MNRDNKSNCGLTAHKKSRPINILEPSNSYRSGKGFYCDCYGTAAQWTVLALGRPLAYALCTERVLAIGQFTGLLTLSITDTTFTKMARLNKSLLVNYIISCDLFVFVSNNNSTYNRSISFTRFKLNSAYVIEPYTCVFA